MNYEKLKPDSPCLPSTYTSPVPAATLGKHRHMRDW